MHSAPPSQPGPARRRAQVQPRRPRLRCHRPGKRRRPLSSAKPPRACRRRPAGPRGGRLSARLRSLGSTALCPPGRPPAALLAAAEHAARPAALRARRGGASPARGASRRSGSGAGRSAARNRVLPSPAACQRATNSRVLRSAPAARLGATGYGRAAPSRPRARSVFGEPSRSASRAPLASPPHAGTEVCRSAGEPGKFLSPPPGLGHLPVRLLRVTSTPGSLSPAGSPKEVPLRPRPHWAPPRDSPHPSGRPPRRPLVARRVSPEARAPSPAARPLFPGWSAEGREGGSGRGCRRGWTPAGRGGAGLCPALWAPQPFVRCALRPWKAQRADAANRPLHCGGAIKPTVGLLDMGLGLSLTF